jgi:hypothetical protein
MFPLPQPLNRSRIHSQKRGSVQSKRIFWIHIIWRCKNNDGPTFLMLGTRIDNPVQLGFIVSTISMAKIFCENLCRNVVDMFSTIMDNRLCDALDKLIQEN